MGFFLSLNSTELFNIQKNKFYFALILSFLLMVFLSSGNEHTSISNESNMPILTNKIIDIKESKHKVAIL